MSDLEHVYRIQDKHGRGPWRPGFSHHWVEEREDHQNLIPWTVEWPSLQLISAPSTHYGCGCESLDQLRRWFTTSEYLTLSRHGYQCVRLRADRILASGPTQCVFARHRALRKGVTVVDLYG